MTPTDLIADLRSRINPAYVHQRGTESYERRLCVEALEALLNENTELRAALYDEQYGITATTRNDEREAAILAERMACATICHHQFMELEHGTDRSDPQDDREASIQSRLAKELRNAIRDR